MPTDPSHRVELFPTLRGARVLVSTTDGHDYRGVVSSVDPFLLFLADAALFGAHADAPEVTIPIPGEVVIKRAELAGIQLLASSPRPQAPGGTPPTSDGESTPPSGAHGAAATANGLEDPGGSRENLQHHAASPRQSSARASRGFSR